MTTSKMVTALAVLGLAMSISGAALAEDAASYPSRNITIIVPFPPGASTDLVARYLAPKLKEALGQTVIVENKSGAGSLIGATYVAKAAPDGYTLLLGTVGTAVTNQFLYKKMPYDTATAFAPVALFGEVANVLAVNKSMPVKTAKEYVEYCKKQGPGKVSFGSPAIGGTGHLAMEYFQSLAGFKVEHTDKLARVNAIYCPKSTPDDPDTCVMRNDYRGSGLVTTVNNQ